MEGITGSVSGKWDPQRRREGGVRDMAKGEERKKIRKEKKGSKEKKGEDKKGEDKKGERRRRKEEKKR